MNDKVKHSSTKLSNHGESVNVVAHQLVQDWLNGNREDVRAALKDMTGTEGVFTALIIITHLPINSIKDFEEWIREII